MDRLAQNWFGYRAELVLLKKHATAYQDHFNDLMEAVHGADFIRVRPAGSVGDRKCDGYLQRTDTVFQVYAPLTVKTNEWLKKIDEDFHGALSQWASMRGWTFVHNQHDGLPPDITQAIIAIRDDNPSLIIEPWPPSRLMELSANLAEAQLIVLFGYPPRDEDMRTLDRSDIAAAVAGLATEMGSWVPGSDLPVVDPRKLDYNMLSEYVRRLITAGITQSSMVEGYFVNNPDPNLRDRIATVMKDQWMRIRTTTTPDAAFAYLYDHVTTHARGSREVTASLALLAYLFESCDVFDNPPADWKGLAS
jgi:hypothetical protein